MIEVYASEGKRIPLGKQGEDQSTLVIFDVAAWIRKISSSGTPAFALVHQRYGDEAPYPVATVFDSEAGTVSWTVGSADVGKAGYGSCELTMTIDGKVAKSVTYATLVREALGETTDPPEPYQAWVDEVIAAGAAAAASAEAAAGSAETAEEAAQELLDSKATDDEIKEYLGIGG